MSRIPASRPSSDTVPVALSSGLTDQQSEIVRLSLVEGWETHRIATFLRMAPRTLEREKAEALRILRTAKFDARSEREQKSGRDGFDITILLTAHDATTRTDVTPSTVEKLLRIPGMRAAYYAPDTPPHVVKAVIAAIDLREQKRLVGPGKRAKRKKVSDQALTVGGK